MYVTSDAKLQGPVIKQIGNQAKNDNDNRSAKDDAQYFKATSFKTRCNKFVAPGRGNLNMETISLGLLGLLRSISKKLR